MILIIVSQLIGFALILLGVVLSATGLCALAMDGIGPLVCRQRDREEPPQGAERHAGMLCRAVACPHRTDGPITG